ncbi:Thiosulfate sulfurtransferase [Penicillium rolfsii]|nr:Thiosulfate sulfurtransferase [Penicillium rolfsii]
MSSPSPFSSLFVSPAELLDALSDTSSGFRVIPLTAGRNSSLQSFELQHIPGSIFLNMDIIRDTNSQYPMMLPSPSQFASYMTNLQIRPSDVLVIYDPMEPGFYSSPRVAWMCQHFGHKAVHVLNTFPHYVAEGFPVATGKVSVPTDPATDVTYPEQSLSSAKNVISFEELRDIIADPRQIPKYQIIDSRPSTRFSGPPDTEASALPVGHIPSAINIPFSSLLGSDKKVLSPAELVELFNKAGVKEDVPTVLYCNTGVTAAGLDLALNTSGLNVSTRLYDGSWSEWTKRADREGMMVNE